MDPEVKRLLRFYKAIGITDLLVPPEMSDRMKRVSSSPKAPPQRPVTLGSLQKAWAGCDKCRLAERRHNLVFGEGNGSAELMFVGEGPGRDEDMEGRPFVGKAGELLSRIIAAMGLQRERVYITNVVKCRPPRNRDPLPEEIASCAPCLQAQIELIQPKVICALGRISAHALLKTDAGIRDLRGRFHALGEIKIMPTYHPAALFHDPSRKKDVWNDVQKIMTELGIERSHEQKR